MLITHTQNAAGDRRIYLGPKGSLEGWLEPTTAGGWVFCWQHDPTSWLRSVGDVQAWAADLLTGLAAEVGVPLAELPARSFDELALYHTPDPDEQRRQPRRRRRDQVIGFVPTPPDITRIVPRYLPGLPNARKV